MIEKKMKDVQLDIQEAQGEALEGYEKMTPEEKNKGKYMTTFPYPYMNGYLHLGKYTKVYLYEELMALPEAC